MASLGITKLRRDGGTQPRAGIYTDTVEEYAEALDSGASFPPVVVFYDGSDYWLADGFHRTMAHEKAGRTEIEVEVCQGTRRDAVLHSTGANATHGLPRTREDKRRAVETLLLDDDWSKWADIEIARRTATSHPFVAKRRSAVTCNVSSDRTFTNKHGTVSTMNTAAIGITAEEVERRERAAAEKAAADARAQAEKGAAVLKAELAAKDRIISAGSANERRAMDDRDAAQKQADDAKAKLAEARNAIAEAKADKARALADKDEAKSKAAELAEKAAEEAWQEADEKYETIVNRLTREAREAKEAVSVAEANSKKAAEEMAAAIAEKALQSKKKEFDELERMSKAAQENSKRAYAAEQLAKERLAGYDEFIKKHNEEMSKWQRGEAETAEQVRIALALAEAVGKSMSDLMMLDHAPQDAATGKFQRASQMCRQMADAIDQFLAPRIA